MVAYLKKPEGSEGFHQIVDFLNASHISNMKRASKGYTGENIPMFPVMIVQGIVVQGEGLTHLESVVPQPRSPTQSLVADEAASTGVNVRYGGATTTVTGLEVGQGCGNTDKTPTIPHDSPFTRVNTLGSDEGSMTLQELMVFCTTLSKKGRKIAEIDQDPAISLVQHDVEIQGRHEHDMEFGFDFDTAKDVSTAKSVSTAGAAVTKPVSTAGAAVTTASIAVLKIKVKLEEEERHRIARVHEAASSFNVEEWEDIQARVEADEELAQRLQAEEREMYTKAKQARMLHIGSHILQQLRGYSFDEIKTLFETTMRRVNTFVPIESEVDRAAPELAARSSKRDAKEELGQESSKRQNVTPQP
ncbi:hypothetical protein Tco_0242128 [Tanacetum coccineum]